VKGGGGIHMKVAIYVGFLPKDPMPKRTIMFPDDKNIRKGMLMFSSSSMVNLMSSEMPFRC
jgi:hypothetical protein